MHSFSKTVCVWNRNFIACTFSYILRGSGGNIGSCMRTTFMEDSQRSYGYEDEFIRLHDSMGNAKTKSNGRIGREEPIELVETMRGVHI